VLRSCWVVIAFLPTLGCGWFQRDSQLTQLHSILAAMRRTEPVFPGPRGVTPRLTEAKHLAVEWVEGKLSQLKPTGNLNTFQKGLNTWLLESDLFCRHEGCSNSMLGTGYVETILLDQPQPGLLTVRIPMAIDCGVDESVYLYSYSEGTGWRRIWQNEQNIYTEDAYKPQRIEKVLVSPEREQAKRVVATIGVLPWCFSNHHPTYYRVFRTGAALDGTKLVDGEEWSFVDGAATGKVSTTDAFIEFTVTYADGFHRRAIRHFDLPMGGPAKRVDPIAFTPREFVAEWLSNSWTVVAAWTAPTPGDLSMPIWHRKLTAPENPRRVQLEDPIMRCAHNSAMWSVAAGGHFFLVRRDLPDRFRMFAVSGKPFSGCNEVDRSFEELEGTMFPKVR
jgi:hypothetical protein